MWIEKKHYAKATMYTRRGKGDFVLECVSKLKSKQQNVVEVG